MDSRTALEMFDLPSDFTEQQLRKAYRRESKDWHPDVSQLEGAEEVFKALTEAKECLDAVLERRKRPSGDLRNSIRVPEGKAQTVADLLFGDERPDLSGDFCVRDMIGDRCDCRDCFCPDCAPAGYCNCPEFAR